MDAITKEEKKELGKKYVHEVVKDLCEAEEIKNLSGTNFTKCSIAKNNSTIGVDAIIEVSGEGEYQFIVVFEYK